MPSITDDSTSSTTLVIFTSQFPYGKGEHFLAAELDYLIQYFDRIILIPAQLEGEVRAVPDGIEIDLNYAETKPRGFKHYLKGTLTSLLSRYFYSDLAEHPAILLQPKALKQLLGYVANGYGMQHWLPQFIASHKINVDKTLFYTYWLDSRTFGLQLSRATYPKLTLVSRVHGGDLYAERFRPAYIPLQSQVITYVDALFTISEHGRNYVMERYPKIESRVSVARLGVDDPGFDTVSSSDSVLRIVSCAFMLPVKRLSLLIEALGKYGRLHPTHQLEWHHFGDGPLWDTLQSRAEQTLPENVTWHFPGYLLPAEIMTHYQTCPVDVFISVSESEGIPVSIMEAYSCGIPAIATAVGGVPEIVNVSNGILLPETPSIDDIVTALHHIHQSPKQDKRENSKHIWRTAYHAQTNFRAFASKLIHLISSKAS